MRSARSARSSPTPRTSLRTPLTAVHLQAQLAERAATDAERRRALARAASAGLARATHLVEQLLTLAREEPGVAERAVRAGQPGGARAQRRRRPRGDCRRARRRSRHRGRSRRRAPPRRRSSTATPPHCARCCRTSSTTRCATRRPAGASTSSVERRRRRRDASRSAIRARAFPASERERVFDRFYRAPPPGAAGRFRQRPRSRDRQADRRASRRDHHARAGTRRRRRRPDGHRTISTPVGLTDLRRRSHIRRLDESHLLRPAERVPADRREVELIADSQRREGLKILDSYLSELRREIAATKRGHVRPGR